jgi:hypothetical protein
LPLRKAFLKVALERTESSAVVAQRVLEAAPAAGRQRLADQWRGFRDLPAPPSAAAGGTADRRRGGGPGTTQRPRRRQGSPAGLERG